jgi:multidrug resistance efflux pump
MAVAYAVLDEATVRNALNRLEAVCAVQDSKLEYLNAQLRVLQDSVATAAVEANATKGANRQKFLVNLKHMSPEKYAGLRGAIPFRSWAQDIKDLVARFSVELLNAMTATENQAERIPSDTIPSSVQDEDAQLRSALRAFTVAEPRAVINAAIDRGDSGLEIWRTLVTQYDPDNDSTRLDESTYILNPGRAKNMGEVQLLLTK